MSLIFVQSLDPVEFKDYTFDFSDRLTSPETISSVEWSVPTTLTSSNPSNTTTSATIWLSGGTPGEYHDIECKVTTSSTPARILKRTGVIRSLTL